VRTLGDPPTAGEDAVLLAKHDEALLDILLCEACQQGLRDTLTKGAPAVGDRTQWAESIELEIAKAIAEERLLVEMAQSLCRLLNHDPLCFVYSEPAPDGPN
jgi:hypothetical protein